MKKTINIILVVSVALFALTALMFFLCVKPICSFTVQQKPQDKLVYKFSIYENGTVIALCGYKEPIKNAYIGSSACKTQAELDKHYQQHELRLKSMKIDIPKALKVFKLPENVNAQIQNLKNKVDQNEEWFCPSVISDGSLYYEAVFKIEESFINCHFETDENYIAHTFKNGTVEDMEIEELTKIIAYCIPRCPYPVVGFYSQERKVNFVDRFIERLWPVDFKSDFNIDDNLNYILWSVFPPNENDCLYMF